MALMRISNNVLRQRLQQTGLYQTTNSRAFSSEEVAPNPVRKWKTWKDVPDNLIKNYSERDPYNMVYQDPEWVALKKKQLWWTQDMEINPGFTYGKSSLYKTNAVLILLFFIGLWQVSIMNHDDYVKYRAGLKQMRENPPDWRTPPEKRGLVFVEM